MSLPACFIPDTRTVTTLRRVEAGYDVQYEDASGLVRCGMLDVVRGPSSGSGYSLTDDGVEALRRVA